MSSQQQLPEDFCRYRILKKLGAAGMGVVYLAEDYVLRCRVALKVPVFDKEDNTKLFFSCSIASKEGYHNCSGGIPSSALSQLQYWAAS